jgi:hypothetical protein
MASLSVLYSRALHLSPIAAQLSLRHMRCSPSVPLDLHLALFEPLLHRSAGINHASTEDAWFKFQQGVDEGPPPGIEANSTNEALALFSSAESTALKSINRKHA